MASKNDEAPPAGGEIYKCRRRTFAVVPDDNSDRWHFLELIEGQWVEPEDLVRCSASKSFVKFHIRSQLEN